MSNAILTCDEVRAAERRAVENGISFFVYDWYWRNGHEELSRGLNDGFLKARYRRRMEFALMWANHPPFSAHTPEQLGFEYSLLRRFCDRGSKVSKEKRPVVAVNVFLFCELFSYAYSGSCLRCFNSCRMTGPKLIQVVTSISD